MGVEYFVLPARSALKRESSRHVAFAWTLNPCRGGNGFCCGGGVLTASPGWQDNSRSTTSLVDRGASLFPLPHDTSQPQPNFSTKETA